MDKPDYYARLPFTDKIIPDWYALSERVEVYRALGCSIVLANGVFDLLHPGHLLKLADCRRDKSDFLIVSADTSARASYLKGRWTALSFNDRAVMLAALPMVDAVTMHAGGPRSLSALARLLRPTRWHRRDDAPEAEVAGLEGCEIVRSPRNGDWSSSALRGA